ncbi:MAG: TetR/AcrR family transcriptional regulator [Gemmatimonadetes bacterium]|nr:TetR/AcrR family transcriptional regulator [Gemmatimonadota bacterium]
MGEVKRTYDSPRRRRQAEATRRRLAASARKLFAQRGYAATTIESITSDAGVAVQTFYATFGSKRTVLFALLDEVEREADLPGLREQLRQSANDPPRQLRHVVDFNVRLFQGTGDVLEVLRAAGSADADLASAWREGEDRRCGGQAPLVREWVRLDALSPGLQEHEAADILWAFTGPDTYRLFIRERGWSVSRYADWLTSALQQLLFKA